MALKVIKLFYLLLWCVNFNKMQIDLDTINNVTKKEEKRYLYENEISGAVGETIKKITIMLPNNEGGNR